MQVSTKERQAAAAAIGVGLVVVLPIVLATGMLLLSGWLLAFHAVPNIHATVWGWLSTRRHGNGTWRIGNIVPEYFAGVLTAYLAYQLGELLYGSFRVFRRALTA